MKKWMITTLAAVTLAGC
ncbi:lipoprotein, partial [Erwinia billingiae]